MISGIDFRVRSVISSGVANGSKNGAPLHGIDSALGMGRSHLHARYPWEVRHRNRSRLEQDSKATRAREHSPGLSPGIGAAYLSIESPSYGRVSLWGMTQSEAPKWSGDKHRRADTPNRISLSQIATRLVANLHTHYDPHISPLYRGYVRSCSVWSLAAEENTT